MYLEAEELRPPDAQGVGRRVRLQTKGWLPYTLRWNLDVVASRYPFGFTLQASGDFDGVGVWTFQQDGRFVDLTYDWRVRAEKPLLRRFSFLLRPLFEANHQWAMREGEESLALELARRRATSEAARAAIPRPPGPVTYSGIALIAGAAAGVAAGAVWAVRRRARVDGRFRRTQATKSGGADDVTRTNETGDRSDSGQSAVQMPRRRAGAAGRS